MNPVQLALMCERVRDVHTRAIAAFIRTRGMVTAAEVEAEFLSDEITPAAGLQPVEAEPDPIEDAAEHGWSR